MKPVRQVACSCSIYGDYIEHLRNCAVVVQRRRVLRLYARDTHGSVCFFNPIRRRLRTAKRRAGKQAAA